MFDPSRRGVEVDDGEATLEPYDRSRADRLFEKYLGDDRGGWPEMFRGLDAESYRLIRFNPETVVARDQSYPAPVADG